MFVHVYVLDVCTYASLSLHIYIYMYLSIYIHTRIFCAFVYAYIYMCIQTRAHTCEGDARNQRWCALDHESINEFILLGVTMFQQDEPVTAALGSAHKQQKDTSCTIPDW